MWHNLWPSNSASGKLWKKKEPACAEDAIQGNLAVANKLETTRNAQKQKGETNCISTK